MIDRDYPGKGKKVGIIGIPLGFGAGKRGSGLGTRTIRQAKVRGQRLSEHITDLGYEVHDWEDLVLPRPLETSDEKPKFLTEMVESVEKIVPAVKQILEAEELPIILGGDHSIALPTFTAIQSYFHAREEEVGLIWFDAHADMNTPETSPSGNLHGMPLAHLLGYGLSQLVNLGDLPSNLSPIRLISTRSSEIR